MVRSLIALFSVVALASFSHAQAPLPGENSLRRFEGRDPQLEKAVQIALEQLRKNPPAAPKRPKYPVYK